MISSNNGTTTGFTTPLSSPASSFRTKYVNRRSPGPFHASQVFDLDCVINKQDCRTTFMIRNIPNKYNQIMLMEYIDATHKGTYDFLYLRIDFQNKCNMGYAFINFINVASVVSFAQQRMGTLWNRFNSEKRFNLSYAKVQGKDNLIQKFRNSDVMKQPIEYRPMLFYSAGSNKGEQQPFPCPTNNHHH
ncbi:RNA recognition motif 2-domain-containing protein [Chlamydoabsidia padenii]|nr:RNA recognition motif 2-domain-containing protein [Chlamydoabsidia padenii]